MAKRSAEPTQSLSASEILAKESDGVVTDDNGEIADLNATETRASGAGNGVARTGPAKARTGATTPEASAASGPSGQAQRETNSEPRFHIFVIDSGWNSVASKILQENLDLIRDLNSDDLVYFVDREASIALLRKYSWQIGRDPIICVHDLRAHHRHRVHHAHGFRMHLGNLDEKKRYCRPFRYSRVS